MLFVFFLLFYKKKQKEMTNKVNLFIPFIENYISSNFIQLEFQKQRFGNVLSIDMREKKIVKNKKNKKQVCSANHYYAFLEVELWDTVQGNNMKENCNDNKSTFIMFHDGKKIDKWQCKNYISVEKREERGFDLHIGNLKKEKTLSLICPVDMVIAQSPGERAPRAKNTSFYDNSNEKLEIQLDYIELEKEIEKYREKFYKLVV